VRRSRIALRASLSSSSFVLASLASLLSKDFKLSLTSERRSPPTSFFGRHGVPSSNVSLRLPSKTNSIKATLLLTK